MRSITKISLGPHVYLSIEMPYSFYFFQTKWSENITKLNSFAFFQIYRDKCGTLCALCALNVETKGELNEQMYFKKLITDDYANIRR